MISILYRTPFSALKCHQALVLENLALRHQLEVLASRQEKWRAADPDLTW